jgi:hypothetical protein
MLEYNKMPKSRIYQTYLRKTMTFNAMLIYENGALLGCYSPRNNPEERSSQQLRGGSQKSRNVHTRSNILYIVRIWLIFENVTTE